LDENIKVCAIAAIKLKKNRKSWVWIWMLICFFSL
jgi:hypothetical protein